MNSPKKVVRTNQALEVIRYSTEGMTITKACLEVGIARSTFYFIYANNPGLFAEFQEMIEASERMQLMTILDRQLDILDKVIEDALAENTKPRQRLAIYKVLTDRHERLREKIMGSSMSSAEIEELLSGPKLVAGKSRFSPSQEVIDMEPELEGI